MPQRIGIREARLRFGDLLRAVKQGTEWVITDRGRPVARLLPVIPDELSLDERIKHLVDTGQISPQPPQSHPLPPPLPLPGDLAQCWLQEDRGN